MAQTSAAFPPLQPAAISEWLQRESDISPEQVVAVSPSAVTAMVASSRGGEDADYQVRLRALALKPDAVARSGVSAWEMSLEVDCVHARVRAGPTVGFADRRAHGQGSPLAPPDRDWRSPRQGTQLDAIYRATCDPHFARPLTGLAAASPRARRADAAGAVRATAAPHAPAAPAPAVVAAAPARPAEPAKPAVVAAAAAPPAAPAARAATVHTHRARAATDPEIAINAIAPEPASPAAPRPTSRHVVQVVSSPNPADSRAKLARLGDRFGPQMAELSTRVEPATVRGHQVYRGMVAGFATRADAAAFCQTLKSSGQDCVLR